MSSVPTLVLSTRARPARAATRVHSIARTLGATGCPGAPVRDRGRDQCADVKQWPDDQARLVALTDRRWTGGEARGYDCTHG
ncbi:hypothetical protein GCM10022629_01660 [Amorphoplanes auranticolor]